MSSSQKRKIEKREWLEDHKRDLVEQFGCSQCAAGQNTQGFVRFWESDPELYEPQRYTFYHDLVGRGPVSKEVLRASVSLEQLKELVSHSVIVCRECRAAWAIQQRTPSSITEKGPRSPFTGLH